MLVVLLFRRKKTRAYEIFESACPGFVRVAAYVRTHSDQRRSRVHDTDIKIDVEDQVRNLLHSTRDRKIRTELLRKVGVTAATCLKARLACLRPNRSKVDNFKFPEFVTSARNWSPSRANRAVSSARGPFVAPSRLVSTNSKSKMAARRTRDCAETGHSAQKSAKSPRSARVMGTSWRCPYYRHCAQRSTADFRNQPHIRYGSFTAQAMSRDIRPNLLRAIAPNVEPIPLSQGHCLAGFHLRNVRQRDDRPAEKCQDR